MNKNSQTQIHTKPQPLNSQTNICAKQSQSKLNTSKIHHAARKSVVVSSPRTQRPRRQTRINRTAKRGSGSAIVCSLSPVPLARTCQHKERSEHRVRIGSMMFGADSNVVRAPNQVFVIDAIDAPVNLGNRFRLAIVVAFPHDTQFTPHRAVSRRVSCVRECVSLSVRACVPEMG